MDSPKEKKLGKLLSKVPEVTIYFWVIKILCTTVGETAADFLNVSLGLGLNGTAVVMGGLLAIALFFQFRASKYIPAVYWLTVVLISVFGTLVTDLLTDKLQIPLEISTVVFTVALSITFAIWYAFEKTLSIHSIFTKRRESFYWLAILFTFALGTASGDLMAESLGLGYLVTGIIVCGVVVAISIAWKLGLDSILAFWIVYIMTRPLGASLGDYLSQSHASGGLGFGPTVTSVIFLSAILLTVIFLTISKRDMIATTSNNTGRRSSPGSVFAQVVIVVTILLSASWGGYHWRHAGLQISTAAESSQSAGKNIGLISDKRPLGDLSSFRKIAVATLYLVDSGKLSDAKSRIKDLEIAWDQDQAKLKPMNQKEWEKLDASIDVVLRKLRSFHPGGDECHKSIHALIMVIDELDNNSLNN